MKLVRYCVMNFRSVKNSGWIDCDDVTTLVGVNESGKSNLLLALWKLNPARGGEIDILHDMPVSELSTLRNRKNEVKFISAEFEMEKDCAEVISKNTGYKCEEGMRVIVSRFYDAAMGLSVSDILLQGCQPIIVEGPSDQIYFNAIKNILIQKKLIAPKYELVFIPSGGVRGVPGIVSILCGKTEKLPFVILDSDKSGNDAKKKLQSGLYKECPDRILEIKKYKDIENAEVEDLIPFRLIERGINRIFHDLEDMYFEDEYEEKSAIVPQIEEFASKNNVALEKGWKVEVARNMKHMLKNKNIMQEIKDEDMEIWKKIFIDFDK